MEDFKASEAAAKRLRTYLTREFHAPIEFKDKSSFDWREFIVVPYERNIRKAFVVSYETNIHNTTAENLIQSFRDDSYTVSLILNTDPLSRVWIDMSVDEFIKRSGIKIDLTAFE